MKLTLKLSLCLLLFLAVCHADILGSNKAETKESKKTDSESDADVSESSEMADETGMPEVDSEYLQDLRKVVHRQLQELKDYMSTMKDSSKKQPFKLEDSSGKVPKSKFERTRDAQVDEDSLQDALREVLNEGRMGGGAGVEGVEGGEGAGSAEEDEEGLLEGIKGVSQKMMDQLKTGWYDTIVELPRSNLEVLDENPQEVLDQLPPLPEPEEEPLTPELEEAKRLYESAMHQLSKRSSDVRNAVQMLRLSAEKGNVPAEIRLAWAFLFQEGGDLHVDKAKETFEKYTELGNPDAQAGLAFMYATGIGVPVSQARALVLYTLASLGDNTAAQMALAYRYWSGVTVTANCEKALHLYRKVATRVASEVTFSGGPAIQRVHLVEEQDSAGLSSSMLDNDLIEYYQLLAEKGDIQAQVGLGQLHYQGGRGVTLDVHKALHYFQAASKAGNAVAMAFLGKIYLEGGDDIKADNDTALRYFKKAAELNNPVGQSGLGLMYLQGRGVPRDTHAALKYFTLAANQGWVDGQLHLANMYFGGIGVRRDFKLANKYFSLASQSGHVLAFYHLGQMHAQGLGVIRSCTTAVELFKNVCERGKWGERLMAGHGAWRERRADAAFLQYAAMAEQGYEVAQSNAAYLLDKGEVGLFGETEEVYVRALVYWGRAAAQGYSAARVKLGDYHYYGLGTRRDYEAAASHYRVASEQQRNAQATFNLGYMHERGLGLARDVHLAKRCYDLAADTAPEAKLPVALALLKLNIVLGLDSIKDGPLSLILLSGDSAFLSNWDLYLISTLVGALGLVVYFRRPQPPPVR